MVQTVLDSTKIKEAWFVSAKAHAKLSKQKAIVKILEKTYLKAYGKKIADPPTISVKTLDSYTGNFIGQRFDQVTVSVKDGQLQLGALKGRAAPLIARGKNIFERGASEYEFQMKDGKVVGFSQSDVYSKRTYVRDNSVKIADTDSNTKRASGNEQLDNAIAAKDTWPTFRGHGARGIAVGQNLPKHWDLAKGEGVLWKTKIDGLALSAPAIWKHKVFVTTATSEKANYGLRIGLYGAVNSTEGRFRPRMEVDLPECSYGKSPLVQTRPQRETSRQTAHQVFASQLHTRHRWRKRGGSVQFRWFVLLRHQRESELETRSGHPRQWIFYQSRRSMGFCQFADYLSKHRDGAG